jgi:hypothetical protein
MAAGSIAGRLFILAKLAWDTAQVEHRRGIDHGAVEMSAAERPAAARSLVRPGRTAPRPQ